MKYLDFHDNGIALPSNGKVWSATGAGVTCLKSHFLVLHPGRHPLSTIGETNMPTPSFFLLSCCFLSAMAKKFPPKLILAPLLMCWEFMIEGLVLAVCYMCQFFILSVSLSC